MSLKHLLCPVILVILLFTPISAGALNQPQTIASEPFMISYIEQNPTGYTTYISMARHPNGKLYLSYYDGTNNDLKLAYNVTTGTGNCGPNQDWKCQTVDSEGNVGTHNSLDLIYVVPGGLELPYTKVGISYFDDTNDELKYAECRQNITGTCVWTISTITTSENITSGPYTSMKFLPDETPMIAYQSTLTQAIPTFIYTGRVNFAEKVSSGGNCGETNDWYCQRIASETSSSFMSFYGSHISMDYSDADGVHIVYHDPTGGLTHARYAPDEGDGTCPNSETNNWYCSVIDAGSNLGEGVGNHASLHASDNSFDPMKVAYYDENLGKLKLAQVVIGGGGNCTNPAFNCFAIDDIGDAGNVPYGIALTIDQENRPVITYMDSSEYSVPAHLKIARPASAYGMTSGNCGEDAQDNLWQCNIVDMGPSFVYDGLDTAVSVDETGLVSIAYVERDERFENFRYFLKLAQQHFTNYLPFIQR